MTVALWATLLGAVGLRDTESSGLSGRAHVLVVVVVLVGALFLLRLLRLRQLRGKYTLLWMFVGFVVLVVGAFPAALDTTADWLRIFYPPNLLFLLAIAFLLLVCVYFSYELSRLEERTRVLAEELAILRGEVEGRSSDGDARASVQTGETPGETDGAR
jgi:hypothetical protein